MVSLENVMEAVVSVTGVPAEKVFGKDRMREVASARHMFCYMARKYTNASLGNVGKFLGRDHTTAINSVKVCNDMLDTKEEFFVNTIGDIDMYIRNRHKSCNELIVDVPIEVDVNYVREFLESMGCGVR